MPINAVILFLLAVSGLAIFYMVIRVKDISGRIDLLSEKLPVTDELRRQVSGTIESLNERIGSLNQNALQIKDVMSEITNLRNLFIMPKGAGGAGERLLEKALHDILPADMYRTQHRPSSGTVDFVIQFKDYMVPIDSKLSLEDLLQGSSIIQSM